MKGLRWHEHCSAGSTWQGRQSRFHPGRVDDRGRHRRGPRHTGGRRVPQDRSVVAVSEATGMVQNIRVAQEAYKAETQQYANVSKTLTDWYPQGASGPTNGTQWAWIEERVLTELVARRLRLRALPAGVDRERRVRDVGGSWRWGRSQSRASFHTWRSRRPGVGVTVRYRRRRCVRWCGCRREPGRRPVVAGFRPGSAHPVLRSWRGRSGRRRRASRCGRRVLAACRVAVTAGAAARHVRAAFSACMCTDSTPSRSSTVSRRDRGRPGVARAPRGSRRRRGCAAGVRRRVPARRPAPVARCSARRRRCSLHSP